MTQVFLKLTAPDNRTPEILQALGAIRLPAELDRDCIRTQLGIDVQDPDVIFYLEEWLSAEGLERRVASPNFRELLSLVELAAEPPTLEFRDIARTRGLEYVASVRGVDDAVDEPAGSRRQPI
jgi:quinol monooxygenase YgiN